jgi:glycosyltransferase involved in cell wall biosynthesis
MKILLSAFAFHPSLGSESAVGWRTAIALAREHQVHVLTHVKYRKEVEEVLANKAPSGLTVSFLGQDFQWHPSRLVAKFQVLRIYARFQRELLESAKRLHQLFKFDLTHHSTIATWRIGSPLWKLPIPLVWGPLGGGEMVPLQFLNILSLPGCAIELSRRLSVTPLRFFGDCVMTARQAAAVIGANSETVNLLTSLRGTSEGVFRLSQAFFTAHELQSFLPLVHRSRPLDGPLRIFAGGNLDGGKGFHLAMESLALARKQGVKFHYTIGGHGPELQHLRMVAARSGIDPYVEFHPGFRGSEYRDKLAASHVYLLPSLRDSAGITLMEAMLAGCVPLVAKRGGPGELVTKDCGFNIPAKRRRQLTQDIAEALVRLDRNRQILPVLAEQAHQRVATNYSEARFLAALEEIYAYALKTHETNS